MAHSLDQPYAAPRTPVESEEGAVAIRRGKLIGVLRDGTLPAVCAKCAATAGVEAHAKRLIAPRLWPILPFAATLAWLHPKPPAIGRSTLALMAQFGEALAAGLLFVLFICFRWARVRVPLCAACLARYRQADIAGVVIISLELTSIALFVSAFLPLPLPITPHALWRVGLATVALFTTLFCLLASLVWFSRSRTVNAWSIDGTRVWLSRLHPSAEAAYCGDAYPRTTAESREA